MRGHFFAEAMGFVHDGFGFFVRKVDHAVQHTVRFEVVSAIRVVFDPVRAVHDLFAHGLARAVHAIHVLNAGWNLSSQEYPSSGYIPVGVMARVATCMRGPGTSPLAMDFLTSTSAYIAPSVSTSRIDVKPFSRAMRALRAPRMAR